MTPGIGSLVKDKKGDLYEPRRAQTLLSHRDIQAGTRGEIPN